MKSKLDYILLLLVLAMLISFNTQLLVASKKVDVLEDELIRLEQENFYLQQELDEFLQTWNIDVFEATAYSPYDDRNGLNSDDDPYLTATGTRPGLGTIAVNFETFPPKTRMWVQGYGWGRANDTGGAMRENPRQIDLFKPTYQEAMAWGRKKVVVVWKKG